MSAVAFAALPIVPAGGGRGAAGPEDYTQWRGRYSDGSASAFVEPDRWPDELQLR